MKRLAESNTIVVVELPEEIWFSIFLINREYWCLVVAYNVCHSWRRNIQLNLREIHDFTISLWLHIAPKLPNIQSLYLYKQTSEVVESMVTLKTLTLRSTNSHKKRAISLAKLSNLSKLSVTSEWITLPLVAPLRKLRIEGNSIIDTNELTRFTQLEKLDIVCSCIDTMVISQLTSLRHLALNLLKVDEDLVRIFSMTQLTSLRVTYRPSPRASCSTIMYENLTHLVNLEKLSLYSLDGVDKHFNCECLSPLTRLTHLAFQNLERPESVSYLPTTLQSLSIEEESFLEYIPILPHLTCLEVWNYNVSLSPRVSQRLPSLKKLRYYDSNYANTQSIFHTVIFDSV